METKLIGGKIAQARKKINISQAQLAERLFISPQAVGKWERGESVPDIITMNRLAEILGVDLNYFSENFPSMTGEMEPGGSQTEPLAEAPFAKPQSRRSWDMSGGNWVDADFSGLKNLQEKFSSSNMQRCKFIGSDMSGLHLKGNNIDSCDFSGSAMGSSRFEKCNLMNNQFRECSLTAAEFSGSYSKGCDFSGADLTGTVFKASSCHKNIMTNAVLQHTTFIGTDLQEIVFEGKLDDCSFENCAFSKVTFQNSTLTNTFFKGESLKRIRFVDCTADRITYEFLKNGKAELTGLTVL